MEQEECHIWHRRDLSDACDLHATINSFLDVSVSMKVFIWKGDLLGWKPNYCKGVGHRIPVVTPFRLTVLKNY